MNCKRLRISCSYTELWRAWHIRSKKGNQKLKWDETENWLFRINLCGLSVCITVLSSTWVLAVSISHNSENKPFDNFVNGHILTSHLTFPPKSIERQVVSDRYSLKLTEFLILCGQIWCSLALVFRFLSCRLFLCGVKGANIWNSINGIHIPNNIDRERETFRALSGVRISIKTHHRMLIVYLQLCGVFVHSLTRSLVGFLTQRLYVTTSMCDCVCVSALMYRRYGALYTAQQHNTHLYVWSDQLVAL